MSCEVTGGVHYRQRFALTPLRRERLVKLLQDGKTATAIGADLGCSRNVIVGLVHRDKSLPRFAGAAGRAAGSSGTAAGGTTAAGKVKVQTITLAPTVSRAPSPKPAAPTPDARMRGDMVLKARITARQAIEQGLIAPPKAPVSMAAFQPGYKGQQARVASLLKLKDHHCKFPIDAPGGGVAFCGDTREDHSPYCPAHAMRCFNPDSAAMRRRFS